MRSCLSQPNSVRVEMYCRVTGWVCVHCIAHIPLLFPHDLVFNMDAAKLPLASLFRTCLLHLRSTGARLAGGRGIVELFSSLYLLFLVWRSVVTLLSRKQYENWSRMASAWGPWHWIQTDQNKLLLLTRELTNKTELWDAWTNHVSPKVDRRDNSAMIMLSYMFPTRSFPALVHGGRTGGIVGNFSEVSI